MKQWGENTKTQEQQLIAPARILVMGPAARNIAGALVRMKGSADICHAESAAEAIEVLSTGRFAHVLVDNLADGALTLTIARLAQIQTVEKITVLAGPNSAESISAMPGITTVLKPPFNPVEIASSLDIKIEDSRKEVAQDENLGRRMSDEAQEPVSIESIENEIDEDLDARPIWMKVISAIFNVIPGLTPLISMLYKHLALTILAALFVAFVSYGVMIVYFLTSGDWSSPLQLQRGHELVAKTERQRSDLLVKRNLVIRQIADLDGKAAEAQESLTRANTLATIVTSTIEQEIANRKQRVANLGPEIKELNTVLNGYGSPQTRRAELARIKRDFRSRIISRRAYDVAALNQIQLDREFALMRQRINDKKDEVAKADQVINYLTDLKSQTNDINAVVSSGAVSEFIPLANQMIEVRQIRSAANSDIASMQLSKPGLQNSIEVLETSLAEIESTPMFRAQEKPVNVLFVPYDNIDAYSEGKSLYACAFAIFWCSNVGEAGKAISGEIVTNHPFFGKPIRGQFVEANLVDQTAAKKEIIHVGRAPLFF